MLSPSHTHTHTHTHSQEILILASDKSDVGQTTVWYGEVLKSVGVFRFKQNSSSITTTVYPDSLQVSPVGDRSLVVVVSYNKQYLYVSRDSGRTWRRSDTPSSMFDPVEELHLSNTNPLHMVLLSQDGLVSVLSSIVSIVDPLSIDVQLYVSYNAGLNWNFITRHVQLVEL